MEREVLQSAASCNFCVTETWRSSTFVLYRLGRMICKTSVTTNICTALYVSSTSSDDRVYDVWCLALCFYVMTVCITGAPNDSAKFYGSFRDVNLWNHGLQLINTNVITTKDGVYLWRAEEPLFASTIAEALRWLAN